MRSNLFTLGICAAISALAFGCGATDHADGESDQDDIGQSDQALNATGPNYGISTATSHAACNGTNSGQSCLVPKSLAQTYCYTGFTASEQSAFDNAIADVAVQQNQHFTIGRALISTADCLSGVAGSGAIKVRPGTGNCAGGSTSGSVEAFVCYNPGGITALTENVPGTWQRMAGGDVFVDSSDLIANDGSTTGCVGLHAMRHAFAAAIGLGATNPSCSGSLDTFNVCITNKNVSPKTYDQGFGHFVCGGNVLSNQEKCEARSYNLSPQTSWSFNPTNCSL